MRSKFQKRSVLKLADRIILHKHGYNTPLLGVELGSRACLGVHTRDFLRFRSNADSCSFNVKVFQKRDSRNRCVNYIALD